MFSPHHRMYYAGFLLDFAISVAFVAMPFYVYRQLGGGAEMSGNFGAGSSFGYAGICILLAGVISRAPNALHWALSGMVVFAVSLLLMTLVQIPLFCGLMYSAAFGGMAAVWPSLHAWIGSDPDPDKRSKHLGWFNVAWSAGLATGPLVAGPLVDYDYRLAFGVVFLFTAAGFALVWSLPHEDHHFKQASDEQLATRADYDRESSIHLYTAWAATLVANCLCAVSRTVYPKVVEDLVDKKLLRLFWESDPAPYLLTNAATKYSWMAFGLSLITALMFFAMGSTRRWRHQFSWMAGIQIAAGLAFWEMGHTRSLAMMCLCFGVVGAAVGFTFFASVNYSLADPTHKQRRATINEAMVGIGGLAGSLLFGQMVLRVGVGQPFHWTPAVILVLVLAQWGILLARRRALTNTTG